MSTQHQIAQALTSLENAYNPSDVENGMYQVWEDKGYFQPSYDKQQSFSIALPPPNITGSLHMGHGFNNAIMDTRSPDITECWAKIPSGNQVPTTPGLPRKWSLSVN